MALDVPSEYDGISSTSPRSVTSDPNSLEKEEGHRIGDRESSNTFSQRSILRATSSTRCPTRAVSLLEEGSENSGLAPRKQVSFHQDTVFHAKLDAPRPKVQRNQNSIILWMFGGAIWVLLMGLWLIIGSWFSFRSGRHIWGVMLVALAVQLCIWGVRGVVWCVRALHRTATNQANRLRALREWKDQ
eukprot:GGOE01057116.1.p2 GENE.GGOE01057116.1~~GGOE01057116.1.p2  ORF type:complete len:187 (+),score=59.46 GGOE01057116.1:109-669(+)